MPGKNRMFSHIEDVQTFAHDPYYEEVDTMADVVMSAREHHGLPPRHPDALKPLASAGQNKLDSAYATLPAAAQRSSSGVGFHATERKSVKLAANSRLDYTRSQATITP